MWSKFLVPAAVLALLTGNACAQTYPSVNVPNSDQKRLLTLQKIQEQQQQKRLDDAYKAANKKIPNQAPRDPWGDVRNAPSAPAEQKKK